MYTPKNILITGGAGFIASHVVLYLARTYSNFNLVVLDKMDVCASITHLLPIINSRHLKFIKGDISSVDLLNHILCSEQIDTVMHFAAQTHVDNSFGNSLAFTINNTYGTHVLLEACRQAGTVTRFINVSTDEVYGETSHDVEKGLDENSILDPTNPYSAAKAGAEMMCKAYLQSYKMPIIITRGNNVYGPHQFPEKAIPKFILLAARGQPLPIHGDGSSVRSYLYVDDVVDAFDKILHHGKVGEVYNIGTDKERRVIDVATDIAARFNLSAEGSIVHVRDRNFNDRRYFIGYEKLTALGWREKTTWEEGLAKTLAWYLGNDMNRIWNSKDIDAALKPHPH